MRESIFDSLLQISSLKLSDTACMASNLKKIGICALTFVAIGVLEQRPLWALTIASTQVTSIPESSSDFNRSQKVNLLRDGEITYETNTAENELLSLAKGNVDKIIQASEVSVVQIDEQTHYYITQKPAIAQQTFTPSYSNVWAKQDDLPPRRKVPEPSAILGLIAMLGWFKIQRKERRVSN